MRKYTLRNLRFPARADFNLEDEAAAKLCVPRTAFRMESILRQAVDTRKANHPVYDFTLELAFSTSPPRHPDLSETPAQPQFTVSPIAVSDPHPFIIGMGPAGLFCALAMAENGLQPWLFDRGDPLELRSAKVSEFWLDGVLDPDSNVQFGEGGAGAFSDGKLTSRGKDPSLERIFKELVRFGAPAEIAWQALPHLGTDGIRAVVKKLREYLIAKGCRFHYRSALEDLDLEQGKVRSARISGQWYKPEMIILALGNAARGAFRMLHERGVALEPKPFALGLRIEQKQSHINRLVYGSEKWAELLGPATYRLTASTGFTFCMCPGGHVIAAASEAGGVVTNGMSFAGRRNAFCNSAVVTSVGEVDYGSGLWDGVDLQRRIERSACKSGYLAPAQTASGFLREKLDGGKPAASYLPDVYAADLNALFTSDIAQRLKSALQRFDEILRGFTNEAVLIAPETRTSSPLRITRHNKDLHSLSARNLFPIGEGSGYAGGIVSSAADGWRLGSRFRLG